MINKDDLITLTNYIEENLRASQISGLNFVDTKNFRTRLLTEQNHIIFGRRGAGKSSLIASLKQEEKAILIKLNLEDYKDISFPNIIIHVLIELLNQLSSEVKKRTPIWNPSIAMKSLFYRRRIKNLIKNITELLHEPDEAQETQRTRMHLEEAIGAGAKIDSLNTDTSIKQSSEQEVSRSIYRNKLEFLRKELPTYKKLINDVKKVFEKTSIFLIFDDFYFVPKSVQPEFLDYFHRLTKGTILFLKVATIKHRTRLYNQTKESYIGIEPGHDVFEIDMDYTLDKFSVLQAFMKQLLDNACNTSGSRINLSELFSGDGFPQLCLASGGVPRDFLALFVVLANKVVTGEIQSIGKIDVNEVTIANLQNKSASLKADSAEEKETLENYLSIIRETVYTKRRTNTFLVAKPEFDEYPHERQAIRELVDLRFIHLIDSNISSAPSDGRRYEAYMLDVGLYENARPRNFTQIEPGATDAKSRKDALRGSPRLELAALREKFISVNKAAELQLTDTNKKIE